MTFLKRLYLAIIFAIAITPVTNAQDSAIGYWESHLPYNNAVGVATDGRTVYTACRQGFFAYRSGSLPLPFSKAEGMSDMGMQCVGYDIATSTAILVYTNGNIDLFKDNTFYNLPDLKVKSVSGAKTVYQVYTENGFAYLSTSLGVIVIDLSSHNVKQTYQFIDQASLNNTVVPVRSFIGFGNDFYAVTPRGLFKVNKNNPQIQNYQVWQKVDTSSALISCATVGDALFLATKRTLYRYTGSGLSIVYTTPLSIQHLDGGLESVFVSEYSDSTFKGTVRSVNILNQVVDTFTWLGKPLQVTQLSDKSIYVASYYEGLAQRLHDNVMGRFIPIGPNDASSFGLYAHNKNVWVAHGGYGDEYIASFNFSGLSNLTEDGKWHMYSRDITPGFDSLPDMLCVTKNENSGTVYAGSYIGGLYIRNKDNSASVVRSDVFDSSTTYFGDRQRQVVGLAIDRSNNVWVSTFGSNHKLYALSADENKWYKFNTSATNGGAIAIDNNDQVWFANYVNVTTAGGVTVFNNGGTLNDPSDDASYHLTTGIGSGNLPSNVVLCLAADKNGSVWIGTDNGIAVASSCSAPFNGNPPCDADIPIVQYDKYAGYLFAGSAVRTIAVDGANRKWVGTDDGVWLLSSTADKIIYRFTAENSPLPSNHIQKIAIDDVTGDVYIGTEMGLSTYHSTATEGGETTGVVSVFPNPVGSDYKGPIAIKGLAANSDIRITDINGQLVYRSTSFGGQAVWNGLDYTGRRPQSGVYLVFATTTDGSKQTYIGKIVFMQ